jgi:4-carboxymuconolactone decarboxylase
MTTDQSQVPKHHLLLKERYPEFCAAAEKLGTAARAAGPLDIKTGHLIQLAAAVGVRSEGSVHSHTRRALEAGATSEEIRHAVVLLTSTVGYPLVAAALSWVDDVIG